MATLAQTMLAKDLPDLNISENVKSGVQAGVQLATAAEQVESAKVALEQQKSDLISKQASTANSLLTNLARANPAIAKKMLKQVREKLINLGADPDIADYTISDDVARKRQIAFSQMAASKLTGNPAQAQSYMQGLADLVGFDQASQMFDAEFKRRQQDKQFAIQEARLNKQDKNADKKEEKEYKQALRLSVNQFESIIKKDRENLSNIMGAAELLNGEGGIAQSAARRALAKAYNSGALTDADVNDFAGSKAYADKIVQFLKTGAEGTLSDENIKQLNEVVNKSAAKKRQVIEANVSDATNRFVMNYGGEPERIKQVFSPSEFMKSNKEVSNKEQAAPKTAIKFDPVKFKAEQVAKGKSPEAVDAFLKSKGF
jgi:hypothetical protein